jgi:hypothetical protein
MKKITKSAASGEERGRMTGFSRLIFCAGIVLMFATCSDCAMETNEEKGQEASKEFCNCFKTNTKEKCLEELKSEYSSYTYTDLDFIKGFNDVNTCGINLERITGSALEELKIRN